MNPEQSPAAGQARKPQDGPASENRRANRRLIAALREGDHKAYDIVYLTYQETLGNFLAKLTGSREQADDILQDIFLNIWIKREQLDPDKSFKTYLYVLAKNAAYNYLRDNKKFKDLPAESDSARLLDSRQPDQELIAEEAQLIIEIAVSNMPEKRREVYKMHLENKSYEEMAAALGITEDNARKHLSRARKDIRDLLYLISFFLLASPWEI